MTKWAEMMIDARAMEQEAARLRDQAVAMRCTEEDSGGARCSADALPSHAHRYAQEDFPS